MHSQICSARFSDTAAMIHFTPIKYFLCINTETCSVPCQTSKMNLFPKIVKQLSITIFTQSFILGVWKSSEYIRQNVFWHLMMLPKIAVMILCSIAKRRETNLGLGTSWLKKSNPLLRNQWSFPIRVFSVNVYNWFLERYSQISVFLFIQRL